LLVYVVFFRLDYTSENQHDLGKSSLSMENISSNGGFSIVVLVFGGGNKYEFKE